MNKFLAAVAVSTLLSTSIAAAQTLEECKASQEIFSGVDCSGTLSPYERCLDSQKIFSGIECVELTHYEVSDCAVFSIETGTLTIQDLTIENAGEYVDWEDVRLTLGEDGKLTLESFKEAE